MKQLLEHLEEIGSTGATCREVQNFFELDHGAASGALTRLHRAGLVVRLTETRDRQQVYVALMHAGDRETSEYRPNSAYREDRKPMPLERPEPDLDSIISDLRERGIEPIDGQPEAVLEIVRKYR